MPSDKVPGKSVFVGNIPYGVSEEQIIDIFSRVGQVVGFRLVHDKETGRPKGFGFLEYQDVDTAAAAVRNLNDHDIMGRKLRVDWSNDSGSGGGTTSTMHMPDASSHVLPNPTETQVTLPPLPPGVETSLSAPDAISQTLSAMPAPQLLDLISQMKGMVADNPAQVTQLFQMAPQLAYAIFQALLLLDLTDMSILGKIVQAAVPPQQQATAPSAPAPVIVAQTQPQQPPSLNPYAGYQPPSHTPVPVAAAPMPQYLGVQPGYAPPPPVAAPAAPPPVAGGQEALIAQLMSMTRDQILGLPPAQRDQILQLRAQLGNPVT